MTSIAPCLALALVLFTDPWPATGCGVSVRQEEPGAQRADVLRQDAARAFVGDLIARALKALELGEDREARELLALALDAAIEREALLQDEPAAGLFWEIGALADHLEVEICAHRAFERAHGLRQKLLAEDHADLRLTRLALAWSRAKLGDLADARALARQGLEILDRSLDEGDIELAQARRDLALTSLELGEPEEARSLLERAVASLEAEGSTNDPELSVLRLELAITLEHLGERDQACDLFEQALVDSQSWLIENSEPRWSESGPGWQWAWMELAMKLDFLSGRGAGRVVLDRLFALMEAPNPAEGEHMARLQEALIAALRRSAPGTEDKPSVFITLADAYAGRLRGHCDGWLDAGRGGRAVRTLHRAAELGQLETVKLLLARGVDPEARLFDVVHWEPGEPGLNVRAALPLAASEGHAEVVRVLLAADTDPDHHGSGAMTALAFAARREGGSEIVTLLLEAGADPLLRSEKGWQPLEWAAFGGDYEAFLTLLDAARTAGMTLEDERVVAEHLEHKNGDLRHCMLQALSREEPSPLHMAARRGPTGELERLLSGGADPNIAMQGGGWRPLHWAAGYEGDVERTRLLLESGADPSAATVEGYTPLVAAVQAASLERVQMLLDRGADPNAVDVDERTALHVAAWRAGPDVVRTLLSAGASVTLKNRWTQTPLDLARTRAQPDVVELLQAAWDGASWPKSADEIEFVGHDQAGASPGHFWPGEIGCHTAEAGIDAYGNIWVESPTLSIAFQIYWRFGGKDHLVGSLVADEGAVRSFEYSAPLDASAPEMVDIVLKPDRELAFDELSTWKIWGEDVVLSDISVPHEK